MFPLHDWLLLRTYIRTLTSSGELTFGCAPTCASEFESQSVSATECEHKKMCSPNRSLHFHESSLIPQSLDICSQDAVAVYSDILPIFVGNSSGFWLPGALMAPELFFPSSPSSQRVQKESILLRALYQWRFEWTGTRPPRWHRSAQSERIVHIAFSRFFGELSVIVNERMIS